MSHNASLDDSSGLRLLVTTGPCHVLWGRVRVAQGDARVLPSPVFLSLLSPEQKERRGLG